MEQSQQEQKQETIVEKFHKEMDVEDFKRKLIAQIMSSTAGRNPLDYYLAELAATAWLQNFDKSPEELEEYIRSIPVPPAAPPDEGGISVIDTEEIVPTYKEVLLSNLPEAPTTPDERVDTVSPSSQEA